ncbi:tetratricopeptide repeat protein [Coleofasciculus sp. LEGE 07092]|nr:tetratricopeptide repeat protein [Coleofasciculus sp. LEGE 07081]MBE9151677.1 tetratricopeptide repeat protein [Coleofasciculus sp. LEGE 07092]
MIPLLGSVFQENKSPTTAAPSATPTMSAQARSQLEEQAKGYELVVQREPQNQTALQGLLETRLKLGDIPGAIAPLEQLAKLNPDQTEYRVLLAQAKQQTGDREGAAQTYRTLLASKPGDLNALEGLTQLLIEQNRPEAAVGLLQDTLKTATQLNDVQPGTLDVTSVQLLLGKVYANQQRYTEALVIYDQAIEANEQDFRPVLAKAVILKRQGKTEEAKPLFTTAVSLAPAQYKDQVKQLATAGEQPAAAPNSSPSGETSNFPDPLPSESP